MNALQLPTTGDVESPARCLSDKATSKAQTRTTHVYALKPDRAMEVSGGGNLRNTMSGLPA